MPNPPTIIPIAIPFQHCNSDNLALLALLDLVSFPPPGLAVRWQPRYSLGLPPFGVTLYWRNAIKLGGIPVQLDGSAMCRKTVRAVENNDVIVPISGRGVSLQAGTARVHFSRPVVAVELIAAESTLRVSTGAAYHSPDKVADMAPSAANAGLGKFNANLIETIEFQVVQAGVLSLLQVTPLAQVNNNQWLPVTTFDWTSGQWSAEQKALLASLFDASVKDASGTVVPMAERALVDGQGTVSLPKLAMLLFSAFAPATARQLGLLYNPAALGNTTPAVDFAVVAGYAARTPLTGASRLDYAGLAIAGQTQITSPFAYPGLLQTSSASTPLQNAAAGVPAGLKLDGSPIWITFNPPVQAVELRPDPKYLVEITAFAQTPSGHGGRVVDWVQSKDISPITLCGDRIDAVCLQGDPGASVASVGFVVQDGALSIGPAAGVGQMTAVSLNAQTHSMPAAPASVMAKVLPVPVAPPPPVSAPPGTSSLATRDPNHVMVAVSFQGHPPPATLSYDAAAYTLSRGTTSGQQTQVLAAITAPLILTDQQTVAAPPAQTAAATIWAPRVGVTSDPAPTSSDFVDTVPAGASVVYGVRSLDLFGRQSAPVYSPATQALATTALPPPVNVTATAQADGTFLIAWTWPGDPALGTISLIDGFRIYLAPSKPVRATYDGEVTAISEAVAGEPASPAGLPLFHAVVSFAPGQPTQSQWGNRTARIGKDHYIICDATQATTSPAINLRLYANPSTPALRPTAGESVSVFDDAPTQELSGSGLYDMGTRVPLIAAKTATQTTVTINAAGSAAGTLAWPAPGDDGVSNLSVGVSAFAGARESPVCGPIPITHVDKSSTPPPMPPPQSEADTYTDQPNAYGHCRFNYEAFVAPGGLYHVYRALDAVLLSLYRSLLSSTAPTPAAPSALGQFSSADYAAALGCDPSDSANYSNANLHALANMKGLERAFERLTTDPIGLPVSATAAASIPYLDATLAGGGANRLLYRLRAVSKSGEPGEWGWVSAPVWLCPNPPVRPTWQSATVAGAHIDLQWNLSPEPAVSAYLVYYAGSETAAADPRTMTFLGSVPSTFFSDPDQPSNVVEVTVPKGSPAWFRVVAVAQYPAPVGTLMSGPSDTVMVTPQTVLAPVPPGDVTGQRAASAVTLTFHADDNPTSRYQLLRAGIPVTGWVATNISSPMATLINPQQMNVAPGPFVLPVVRIPFPMVLTDASPLAALSAYTVACTNESGRVSISTVTSV